MVEAEPEHARLPLDVHRMLGGHVDNGSGRAPLSARGQSPARAASKVRSTVCAIRFCPVMLGCTSQAVAVLGLPLSKPARQVCPPAGAAAAWDAEETSAATAPWAAAL